MIKIKICGLMTEKDCEIMNKYKPDYCGFVFAKSRHFVSDETAKKLRKCLDKSILSVGVFVNDDLDHIADLYHKDIIQVIQLHGDEDKDTIQKLRLKLDEKALIIKAVRVSSKTDFSKIKELPVDMKLYDSFSIDVAGGSGKRFDLSLLPQRNGKFFVAGGVSTENAISIINVAHPYGLDVSSSVETDGHKDETKVREFIKTVREYIDY